MAIQVRAKMLQQFMLRLLKVSPHENGDPMMPTIGRPPHLLTTDLPSNLLIYYYILHK